MFFGIAAILGFLAVALGAFGAHGLKGFLQDAIETITSEEIKKYFLVKLEILLNEYK